MDVDSADVHSGDGARAYTRVDPGLVRVGNRWIERVWSGFTGCTTSQLQNPGEFEWAAAKNPEYIIESDGKTLGLADFGEVEWSEELDELGASIAGVFRSESLEIHIEHLAFHDAPGLLRTSRILNCGQREMKVGPILTESFDLDCPEHCEYVTGLEVSGDSSAKRPFDKIGAVVADDRGLILLTEGNAEIVLGSEEIAACSIRDGTKQFLSPLLFAAQARSLLIPFDGEVQAALDRQLPEIERLMRLHERTIAKREREEE